MSGDIVTRLRYEAETGFTTTDWTQLSFDVQNAADEIERLRQDIKECHSIISRLEIQAKHGL